MDIKDVVKNQIEILSKLDSLLDIEKEILIKDRASELPGLIEKKKDIAKQIAAIEKIRQDLYKNKKAEELVDDGILDKDEVRKLKELVYIIKEKEETNLILTKQSLIYINLITSALNPNPKVVTYGNSGKIDDSKALSVFTTKV